MIRLKDEMKTSNKTFKKFELKSNKLYRKTFNHPITSQRVSIKNQNKYKCSQFGNCNVSFLIRFKDFATIWHNVNRQQELIEQYLMFAKPLHLYF